MSTIQQIEQLSLDEFIRLYTQEGPFEYADGTRIPLMPNVVLHGLMIRAVFLLLYNYAVAHSLGEVITETPYVLLYNSTWVKGSRVPDLMFFAAERWQRYIAETEGWKRKPFLLVPDLAVEIVSPTDLYTEIQDKVERFRADGVRLIWVVDAMRSRVNVYSGDQVTTLGKDSTLSGGDALPGLEIKLIDLFAEAEDQDKS